MQGSPPITHASLPFSPKSDNMSSKDIERFSIWARTELQTQVELRAACYGLAEGDMPEASAWELQGRTLSALEREQRASAVEQVQARGLAAVVEEATYTWFNRFVALRFMEVNGYLETGARWFSTPGQAGFCPEVLAQAHLLNLEGLELAEVERYRREDDEEGLFRYLFVLQCNALSRVLPRLFTPMQDWTQLLCPTHLLRDTGVLAHMVQDIPEEDWTQEVEIVGWLYQHYNTSRKAEVYAGLKKNNKVEKADIAPATQLFTPDWIVRYLVQNSLGRLWMDNHPRSGLAQQMEYYIAPEQPPVDFPRVNSPEELRVCDPACGSGHMLTYAFDLLYAIYEEEGYAAADIPSLILTHNLYGIDLDRRAGELAWFALMMKARSRDRRFLRRGVQPHVCVLEPLSFAPEELEEYRRALSLEPFSPEALQCLRAFAEADNFGSLIRPALSESGALRERLPRRAGDGLFMPRGTHEKVQRALRQAEYLSPRYHVIVANPPYMVFGNMNARLNSWSKQQYPDSKADLFAMFMERGLELLRPLGFSAMVTMESWMFLSGMEKLRLKLMKAASIVSLLHMDNMVMRIAFGTAATVFQKGGGRELPAACCRVEMGDLDERGIPALFPPANARNLSAGPTRMFRARAADFGAICGSPVTYWLLPGARAVFEQSESLETVAHARNALKTGDNERFVRLWHEVSAPRIAFGLRSVDEALSCGRKWFPYNKAGAFRKWYGNQDSVLDWEQGGAVVMGRAKEEGRNVQDYPAELKFIPTVSWGKIGAKYRSFRCYPHGFISDVGSLCVFGGDEGWKHCLLAYLNTNFAQEVSKMTNPTNSFQAGDMEKLPYARRFWSAQTAERATQLIALAKEDWDSCETSWNFRTLPLLRPEHRRATLAETWAALRAHGQQKTAEMARLEEENNRVFNELYGLEKEFPATVPAEQITLTCNPAYRYGAGKTPAEQERLLRADMVRELISYAVGCMFGRYSLEEPGLICAGGPLEPARYGAFRPDADNIIPICDADYFPDDICGRFVDFVRLVFGEAALEENLSFIAEALGGRGAARSVIRNYFLRDFYTDHCKAYGKRPIYWQFSSGTAGGFRALMYLHRYEQDTLARMRTDYVFRQQERYRDAMVDVHQRLESAKGRERVALSAQLKNITEQEAEIAAFEQQLHHLANQRVELNLDAGVVANYARFSPLLTKIR